MAATPSNPVAPDVSEGDRILIEELLLLERSMDRNYRWVYDVIAPFLGRSLLEVGSGVGVMSRYLVERGGPIILSDHHSLYIEHLRARFRDQPNVTCQILDLKADVYDIAGEPVDTIVCLNVLEHLKDDRRVLRSLADLLPVGGRLVLQVPNYPALFGSLDETYGHFRRYTRHSITERLAEADLNVTAIRNFNPLGIPAWILSAKLLRRRRLDARSARLFNGLVPLARRIDFLSRLGGLALIVCGERR